MRRYFTAGLILFSFGLNGVFAQEIITPLYDTYTVAEGGQTNGSSAELWTGKRPSCGHDENTMVHFDLAACSGRNAGSAIFHLNRFFGCPSNVTNVDFFHAIEQWDESYGNGHIAHGSTIWENMIINSNGWWEIDLTDLVNAWLNQDIPYYGVVMECHTGSGTSKFHSKDTGNENVRPYLDIQFTGASTPTPSVTPTPFGTPTSTPSAGPGQIYVNIDMPSDYFHSGDICSCSITVQNGEDQPLDEHYLCAVLDVYGYFYFAPSFTQEFDSYTHSIPIGESVVEVLPEFNWPIGVGQADGIQWLAAILNPELTELISNLDIFIFSWGP
ncbi:DNRLRE domain-containing protein [bacterium]|nr:DNRLRE domain-containing protein [bacterium]